MKLNEVKKAQLMFSQYSQQQVDNIFYEVAKKANELRIEFAKKAVAETKMGIVEDKIIKNHFASEYIYNKYKNFKTVGVIKNDDGLGYEEIYEPMGVICAVIPVTNPTSTAIFKILLSIKTRNGIVISPHPKAYESTTFVAKKLLDAAIKAGAPKNIISWLPKNSSIEDTIELMKLSDIILATGGPGVVKSAYSSGKPAIGVGAGNCPAIIHNSANISESVASIIQSNTFDNGVVCATENSIIVMNSIYSKVCKEFINQGAFIVNNQTDIAKIRKKMFLNGSLNSAIVGQTPYNLGKIFGIDVPQTAKILIVPSTSTESNDPLAHEKLSTLISIYKSTSFENAIKKQNELLQLGKGHTSSLFIDESKYKSLVDKWKLSVNTGRMLINMPSSLGAIGDIYNFYLTPSLTLGCGTWGGNIYSENIGIEHLLNKKILVKRRENMLWLKLPPKIYFKYGCIEQAFNDLKKDKVENVFIVSDDFIWKNYGQKISKLLSKLNIKYTLTTDIEPNPSLSCVIRNTEKLKKYHADAIIAFGGGSVLDAAKMMWLYNEYPNVKFKDLAIRFNDIQKRIVNFPNVGKNQKLICIPTTSGTGSEVTPFAIITDDKTHIKYSLADYSLTPSMAIIDAQFMMDLPPKMTAITAADALSHAFEAYVSVLHNEFTDPYALEAIKTIFEYLPIAYKEGNKNKVAREKLAHAATIAGIAFANAFLGIVHSLSHKIGGYFNVTHGNANAIYLPYVIKYNSAKNEGEKQAYFSQHKVNDTAARYVQIANALGIKGKNETDTIEKLIEAIKKLFKQVGLPLTTKDFGVDTKTFEKKLNQMAEDAFDDQCTNANPRYPLIKDLKEIFIKAHYGKKE